MSIPERKTGMDPNTPKFTLAPDSFEGSFMGEGAEFTATVDQPVQVGQKVYCSALRSQVKILSFDLKTMTVTIEMVI